MLEWIAPAIRSSKDWQCPSVCLLCVSLSTFMLKFLFEQYLSNERDANFKLSMKATDNKLY